ncbi:hypothetical protein TRICI_002875 [Trichomonascus ciferrii]|uniref:Yeast cell wall synthesis Kre9/Knh1-like N-terminal domain-containing protein n=1 Tax=Trichomonascus ciferrii TaxID=44093 RepID=A0A642V5B5_9ASCO|nr:hypothetical protein TRICI_002875 [Trichomonascus ciferrii]
MKFTLATLATLVSAVLAANEFTSPSPNDVLKTGESFVVKWEPSDESSKVNLYLRKGDPDNLENVLTISKNLDNGGAVRWTVPSSVEPGNQYAIEIQDADNEEEVNYSNQFTIEKGEGSTSESAAASGNSTATTSAAATTGASNATTSAPVTTGAAINSTAVTSGAGNATATSGNGTATQTGSGAASGTASGSASASGSGSASGSASGSGAASGSGSGSGSGAASASSTTGGESGASTFAISSFVIAAGIAGAAFAF